MSLAAQRGYENIKSQNGGKDPKVIVAAIHVPSSGISMATLPQKNTILSEGQKTAPIWWNEADKDKKTPNDLRGEGGAMWFSEFRGKFAGQDGKFPAGSYMAAYGVYGTIAGQKPEPRNPCGDQTTSNVPCRTILKNLGIDGAFTPEDEC